MPTATAKRPGKQPANHLPRGTRVDVPTAAEYLGVGERMMRRLIFERRIPFIRVGRLIRLDVADLDQLLAAGRVEAITVRQSA